MATVSNQTNSGTLPVVRDFVAVRHRTMVQEIYAQLRRAILHGRLRPGQWLTQAELAETFRVSRMPIRDALRTLSAEGLVEMLPHRGTRVAPLTVEEFEELYAVRMGLEGLAARLAAERMTPAVLDQMARGLADLERLCRSTDLEAYLAAEADYHRVCYAASARERLCRNVVDLRERAERYLRVVFDSPARFEESLSHQRALFAACQRQDGGRAERTLQQALRWTVRHASNLFERSAAIAGPTVVGARRPRR